MTFIHAFTVIPEKQNDTLRGIHSFYREVIGTQPGFVSARLLKSDDGTRITAIVLWESQEQFAAARQILNFQNFLESEFLEGVSSEIHVYSKFVEVPGVSHKHKHKQ